MMFKASSHDGCNAAASLRGRNDVRTMMVFTRQPREVWRRLTPVAADGAAPPLKPSVGVEVGGHIASV